MVAIEKHTRAQSVHSIRGDLKEALICDDSCHVSTGNWLSSTKLSVHVHRTSYPPASTDCPISSQLPDATTLRKVCTRVNSAIAFLNGAAASIARCGCLQCAFGASNGSFTGPTGAVDLTQAVRNFFDFKPPPGETMLGSPEYLCQTWAS